jgi:hypothetical protein
LVIAVAAPVETGGVAIAQVFVLLESIFPPFRAESFPHGGTPSAGPRAFKGVLVRTPLAGVAAVAVSLVEALFITLIVRVLRAAAFIFLLCIARAVTAFGLFLARRGTAIAIAAIFPFIAPVPFFIRAAIAVGAFAVPMLPLAISSAGGAGVFPIIFSSSVALAVSAAAATA